MKTTGLFLALLAFGIFAGAAEPPPEDAKSADFYVHAGRLKHKFRRAPGVEETSIENGVIHADLRRGKHRYLLIAYTEPSRPSNPMAKCGGGVESYLVWIDLVGDTVTASQSAHYESCWQNIEGGKPAWAERRCTVRYAQTDYHSDNDHVLVTRSVASFDEQAPAKGLEIVSQPPEKQQP